MLKIDEDKLKLLLEKRKKNIERPKFNGVSDIISGISLMLTIAVADFSAVTITNPQYIKVVGWIIVVAILFYGILSFVRNLKGRYSIDNLYSEIADIDPDTAHPFDIILIKNKSGEYLVFKSRRWKCWLFPDYHCQSRPFNAQSEQVILTENLKRDLSFDSNIEFVGDLMSKKYSVGDRVTKKYEFHFFKSAPQNIDRRKNFRAGGKSFRWMTLEKMYSNKNIEKKNKDVLDYVRKHCDIS